MHSDIYYASYTSPTIILCFSRPLNRVLALDVGSAIGHYDRLIGHTHSVASRCGEHFLYGRGQGSLRVGAATVATVVKEEMDVFAFIY